MTKEYPHGFDTILQDLKDGKYKQFLFCGRHSGIDEQDENKLLMNVVGTSRVNNVREFISLSRFSIVHAHRYMLGQEWLSDQLLIDDLLLSMYDLLQFFAFELNRTSCDSVDTFNDKLQEYVNNAKERNYYVLGDQNTLKKENT